jgi:hypothetical protein
MKNCRQHGSRQSKASAAQYCRQPADAHFRNADCGALTIYRALISALIRYTAACFTGFIRQFRRSCNWRKLLIYINLLLSAGK